MSEFLAFAHHLADASEPIIKRYFRSSQYELHYKSDASPVTLADKEVESTLRALIQTQYPQHGIIGEEHGNHQPYAEYQWIIDPIDGTRAFSCGRLDFGTLIGLQHHHSIMLGILNQPICKERFVGCHTAMLNDKTIASNEKATLHTARFATTSAELFNNEQHLIMRHVATSCGLLQYGGDCYNYGLLAAGHIDIIMEAGLNIYDIAPLLPLLHHAGAIVTDWKGQNISLANQDISVLVCANKALHKEVLAHINTL